MIQTAFLYLFFNQIIFQYIQSGEWRNGCRSAQENNQIMVMQIDYADFMCILIRAIAHSPPVTDLNIEPKHLDNKQQTKYKHRK